MGFPHNFRVNSKRTTGYQTLTWHRISSADNMRAGRYSISLDVLLALSRERHAYLISLIYAEEEKPNPDQSVIDSLDQQCWALPQWGSMPDEQNVDAEIAKWKAIVLEQRTITRA